MMPSKPRSGLKLPPFGGRALRYGYSNARVKAMKGLILKPAALDEMIRVGNVEAMAELLQRTGYKSELAAASVSYRGSEMIETAASRGFSGTARKLVRITPASDRDAVRALLVRWDLMNIKTLLNARRLGKGYDEVRPYLFEVGGLAEDDFRRILKADNNMLLNEIWKTEVGKRMRSAGEGLGREVRDAMGRSGPDAATRIDAIVDSYIYLLMDNTLNQVGGKEIESIRRILKAEADAKNVMIIERLKRHGIGADGIRKCLVRGGSLGEQAVARLIEAKDLSATLAVLRQRFPRLEAETGNEGRGTLTSLEAALEKTIAAQKAHAFERSIMSVGVMLGFLLLKEEEVNNLRKIAKGKEFGMSEGDVRAMLVM
jgi:V/A-type H+-transporting ATPase subunit C